MHDFKKFPELTNSQMNFYYFESPHRQITHDFTANVMKVHDGDTITLDWYGRNFLFPLRIRNISARELKETKKRDTSHQNSANGRDSKEWLTNRVLNKTIMIRIDPDIRVDKFGRLLGQIECEGIDIGEESISLGINTSWDNRNDGAIPNFEKMLAEMLTTS